jgi:2-haloalkanoic acid dehalogenase type II
MEWSYYLIAQRSLRVGEMKEFSVVSVDMFGTLVDVSSVRYLVWQSFLKDRYSEELVDLYWERANDLVFQHYNQAIQQRKYIPPKIIFETMYSELFAEIGLDFNPKEAAQILALQHSFSEPFDDAVPFLDAVGKKYPICLSSDTDDDMLGSLRQLYPFDEVVTSEQIGAYKTSDDNRFFSTIINHYNIKPDSIIHIGDSGSDIIGAREAGIATCWLNRNHRPLPQGVQPDYEVGSLVEAASLLGIDISTEQ